MAVRRICGVVEERSFRNLEGLGEGINTMAGTGVSFRELNLGVWRRVVCSLESKGSPKTERGRFPLTGKSGVVMIVESDLRDGNWPIVTPQMLYYFSPC